MKTKAGEIFVGAAGRATEIINYEPEPDDRPDWQGTIAAWFLDCPGQSPAWRHYGLAIVHLRPIEGVRPATITREGATHEVELFALDPRENPTVENQKSWQHLIPLNFVGQLTLPSDADAKIVVRVLARAVAEGILWAEPLLSGQKEPWASQLRKLEEHASGKHAN